VAAFVRRNYNAHPLHDDLLQEARIALYLATTTFDPFLSTPTQGHFLFYATLRMKDAIRGYLHKQNNRSSATTTTTLPTYAHSAGNTFGSLPKYDNGAASTEESNETAFLAPDGQPAATQHELEAAQLFELDTPAIRARLQHLVTTFALTRHRRAILHTLITPPYPSTRETATIHNVHPQTVRQVMQAALALLAS
jgi:DNA-directed RNA polymerase specialized sigma24 family protein